jgi:MFS family permease
VVNAYALSFGWLLLLGGRAGDLLGRRRVFAAGLSPFSAASVAGGFATSQAWLLAARAAQGIGGVLIAPATLALIVTTFAEGPARNRAMSVLAAMSGAGAAVGLIAGGRLTSYLSWRWVLFVNVLIGVATAAAAPFALAGSARRPGRRGSTQNTRFWMTECRARAGRRTAPNGGYACGLPQQLDHAP